MNAHTLYTFLYVAGGFLVKAWGAIGPLVGVLIGAWLGQSWQKKRWLLESKQTEYRELISKLSENVHCILKNWPASGITGRELQEARDAKLAGERLIEDRIFIHKQMRAENALAQWNRLAEEKEFSKVLRCWTDLHAALMKTARKDLRLKD
jgi:hypothetical protein